jgi:hypothetical protein
MKKMNKMRGVIYPIPNSLTSRLFDGKTNVFAKCISHNSTKLLPKHKVIFYASRGQKKLVGEGTIEKIEFLAPDVIVAKYEKTLFLGKDEFLTYVGCRNMILTLTLKDLVKYPHSLNYYKPITMTGQYISNEEYNAIIRENGK